MVKRVNLSTVRRHLTAHLGAVEHGGEQIVIAKHGRAVAAIVSMHDLERIWADSDEELRGPKRNGPVRAMLDMLGRDQRKTEIARLYEEKRARWKKALEEERKLAADLAREEVRRDRRAPWWSVKVR